MFRSLLVVDDCDAVRYGLKLVFQKTNIDVVAEAATCAEALECLRTQAISLVLLDIRLPDGSGLDLLPQIKALRPDLPVLMHTMSDASAHVASSFQRGAHGFVVKGLAPRQLLEVVQRTCNGESVWTADQMQHVARHQALPTNGGTAV